MKVQDTKNFSEKFVRNVLGGFLKVDGKRLRIERNEYEKPFLRDYKNVHFNISHTKEFIVCALADYPIGVDAERIRPVDLLVVKHFYAKDEQDYVFSNSTNINFRFTEIWTKKEAYLKWLGKGIGIPFTIFNSLEVQESNVIIDTMRIDNYVISTCFSGLHESGHIQLIKLTDIVQSTV